jgi:hypothetical protein
MSGLGSTRRDELISQMRSVDASLDDKITEAVPVAAGALGPSHPGSYKHKTDPPILEKVRYTMPLFGDVAPRVDTKITDEDIERLKEKSYVALTRDFHKWLLDTYLGGMDNEMKKKWLREKCPEVLEMWNEAVDSLNAASLRYKLICVNGPQTIQDVYFKYIYERDANNYIGSVARYVERGMLGTIISNDEHYDEAFTRVFERGVMNTRKRAYNWFNEWRVAQMGGSPNGLANTSTMLPSNWDNLLGYQQENVIKPQIVLRENLQERAAMHDKDPTRPWRAKNASVVNGFNML